LPSNVPARVPSISQSILERYVGLKCEIEALEAQRKELREQLLTALEAGAPVEPGAFLATAKKSKRQGLSWGALEAHLAPEEVAELRRVLPRTTIRQLDVFPATPSPRNQSARRGSR
jgi:hypothetical protein